ncbi:MAG TPA: ribosomal L7Ae/L30e/S12e/Gadd45 family protein [Clostridiaceae bacterium]
MSDNFLQFLSISKKAGALVAGYNKSEEAVKANNAKLVIIAIEASINTKEKFNRICQAKKIPLIEGYSKYDLGKFIGKEEISVLTIIDYKISEKLITIYEEKKKNDFGGDVIV